MRNIIWRNIIWRISPSTWIESHPDLTLVLVQPWPWLNSHPGFRFTLIPPSPFQNLYCSTFTLVSSSSSLLRMAQWYVCINLTLVLLSPRFHLVRIFTFILIFLSTLKTGPGHSDFRSKNQILNFTLSSFLLDLDFTLILILLSPRFHLSLGFIIIFIWYQ